MATHLKARCTTLFILISSTFFYMQAGEELFPENHAPASPSQRKVTRLIKDRLIQMGKRIGCWVRNEDPEWEALFASWIAAQAPQKESSGQESVCEESRPEEIAIKRETVQKEVSLTPLRRAFKGLMHAAYKGTRHALKHPFKTLTLALMGHVTAAAASSSNEFRIDQTGSAQWWTPIASINGNAFVVWTDSSANNIAGRIYAPNGTALTNELGINQNPASVPVYPDIANVNDAAFVVWGGFTSGRTISGRTLSPSGTPLTNDFVIYQDAVGNQYTPVVANVNNNACVVWWGAQTGSNEIYGRMVSPTGTPITTIFLLNQNTAGNQIYPAIETIDGKPFVVWQSDQTGDWDIYGRIFFPNLTPFGDAFLVNENRTSTQDRPLIAGSTDGNAIVTFSGSQTGDADSYGRIISPTGTALRNESRINQITDNGQSTASIANLTNGNALAVWHSQVPGGNYDIYGRTLSSDGTPLSEASLINQYRTGIRHSASAVIIGGRAFITWQANQDGPWHVYGRIIDLSEFFTSTTSSTSITSSSILDTTEPSISAPFRRTIPSAGRSQQTTESPSGSSSSTPHSTEEKKDSWKKIVVGTGIAGGSLVGLAAVAVASKKCRSKKDKEDIESLPAKDTFSLASLPEEDEDLPEDYYGRIPTDSESVAPNHTMDDEATYGLTPNVRRDDSTYQLTPHVRPAV